MSTVEEYKRLESLNDIREENYRAIIRSYLSIIGDYRKRLEELEDRIARLESSDEFYK
jgi:hypothetical protein